MVSTHAHSERVSCRDEELQKDIQIERRADGQTGGRTDRQRDRQHICIVRAVILTAFL